MKFEEEIIETLVMGDSIEIGESAVSVTTKRPDGKEIVEYYDPAASSGEIVKGSSATAGLELNIKEASEMTEVVDFAKSNKPYISEVEISLNFREGFKVRIKKEPAKIIKYVSGQKMTK